MDREKIINDYMVKLKISREEAEQLFEDDENDFIGEDGEAMTEKAKANRHREESGKERKKSTKERKVDKTKQFLLDIITKALEPLVKITNIKTETEISFVYNDENYTLKLTKHRKGKQLIDRLHKMQSVFLLHFTIDKKI